MTINRKPSIMMSVKTQRLSEENIAVDYDYSSPSLSDENDSIKTPSLRSSSPDTNIEDIRSADFVDNIPEPTANPPEVRKWIRSWFSQRDLHQHYLDYTIDKLHWTGKDIHNESKAILEGDLATLGFKLYARSLALDILEARGGKEKPQNEIPDSIKEEVGEMCKRPFETNSEENYKAQVQERDEELTRLRYFSRFTSLILIFLLNEFAIVRLASWVVIMCTSGCLFLKDMKKYLAKRAFAIEDERRIQENEKRIHQRKSGDEYRVNCKVDHGDGRYENEDHQPVKTEDEKIGEFPSLDLRHNEFSGIWLNWFYFETIFFLFSLPPILRTWNILLTTCFFVASNEGITLISSSVESILNKVYNFREGPGTEQE